MTKQEPQKLDPAKVRRAIRAALVAWLIPGGGHLILGARTRAAVFFVLVGLTIGVGLACDGNLSLVDLERAPVLSRLQVAGNLALGPCEPVIRYTLYGKLVYKHPTGRSTRPAAVERAIERRDDRSFRRFSAYGTAYLLAAGLMNILLVLDAWDIGIGRRE